MPETEPTAPVDIEALAVLLEAATPGVWKLWGTQVMADQDGTSNVDHAVPVADTYFRDEHGKPKTWDAELIAQTHNLLPALLAEVKAGRERLARVVSTIEAMRMSGAGADAPAARFGYDRARGEILICWAYTTARSAS